MARFLIRYIDSRGVTHRNQVRASDQEQIVLSMESRGFNLLSCTEIPDESPQSQGTRSASAIDTVLVVRSPDGSFHRLGCRQNDLEFLDGQFGQFGYTIVQTAPATENDAQLEHARGALQNIETGMLGTKDVPAFDFTGASAPPSGQTDFHGNSAQTTESQTDPILRRKSSSSSPSESAGINVSALYKEEDTFDGDSEELAASEGKDDPNFLSHAEKSTEFISNLTPTSPNDTGIGDALEVAPVIGQGKTKDSKTDPNNQSQTGKVDIFSLFDDIPESVDAYSSRSLEDRKKKNANSKVKDVFDENSKSPRLRLATEKIHLRKIPVDPDFPTVKKRTLRWNRYRVDSHVAVFS